MDFRLRNGEQIRTMKVPKASATVIEAGDMVEMSSGLAIKGTASGAKLAWCPNGGAAGETEIEITVGNDFTLVGTTSAGFAKATHGNGYDCDMSVSSNNQLINVGATSTKVLTVHPVNVEGATTDIEVKINLPIF